MSTHFSGPIYADAGFISGDAVLVEVELEQLDGVTVGVAAASKAVVLGTSKQIATIGTIGCGAITSTGASSFATIVHTGNTPITFSGTPTGDVIDFSGLTYTPNVDGSNGNCLIRAGTYAAPVTHTSEYQSGMIRLYMSTTADGSSYDRGIFVCLKGTGTKGLFPVAGLAEVLDCSGNGPNKVQAAQFIAHMNSATAALATTGGDATAGMYGAWLKVASTSGSVCASGSKVAPVWIDNQMSGTVSGEEYAAYITCGGTKVDAVFGFNTSSSGWTNIFHFDDTAYDQDPVGTATVSGGTADKYLKVSLNGTAYGIQMYAI